EAKAAYDHIQTLKAKLPVSPSPELARLLNDLPSAFTDDLPYVDMLEAKELFPKIAEALEKEILEAEEEAKRKAEAQYPYFWYQKQCRNPLRRHR
ncbi:MAG: hypothetical protein LBC09_03240, partial [Helicobacteraceae bacterium]|nr:hypothetical protein [Helicobacteraceae bacterium]